ncbi:hypothetical protein [Rubrobacter xylanophilus]|uniref:hypothetical protein n=1 Tax=Rubrobacter xylanophilus TaxID=49319 RepID=UPI001C641317|nr:hypothetical protein [Rubrobacter xylanophilus]
MREAPLAGTRGEIEAHTPRHTMHSALVVSCGGRVMVDWGASTSSAWRPSW